MINPESEALPMTLMIIFFGISLLTGGLSYELIIHNGAINGGIGTISAIASCILFSLFNDFIWKKMNKK